MKEKKKKEKKSVPLLRHFDPLLLIRMESDASSFATSAILSQAHSETGH